MIQDAVVSRVVEDFVDINTLLKQFTDAVHVPKGMNVKNYKYVFVATKGFFHINRSYRRKF